MIWFLICQSFENFCFKFKENLRDSYCNLSTEEAMQISRKWLKQMAQPFTREDQVSCQYDVLLLHINLVIKCKDFEMTLGKSFSRHN